ncbi:MAG: hypothetical protein JST82_14925 [Bacteroidetes bacterium]|nr:hypothetical protein [Bacteroidota bacterium]
MKNLLLIILIACNVSASAQDTLYQMNGDRQLVKLEEMMPGKVKYKLWDYVDGPSYIMPRRDLMKVTSRDGKTLWINEDAWQKEFDKAEKAERANAITLHLKKNYYPNIFTLSPICVLANGVGFAVSYERVNKQGVTGIRLDAAATLDYPSYVFMPSVRIYPWGQHVVTIYASPGIFVAYGSRPIQVDTVDKYGNTDFYSKRIDDFQLGFFAETGAMFHVMPNMVIMLNGGGGLCYTDLSNVQKSRYAGFGKFELGFGYRFK